MPRRFDQALMRPPTPQAAVDAVLLGRLRAWCAQGAYPRLTQPIAVAGIPADDGLDGAACELDGSHALARLGRWRGLAWRLQVLLQEHLPGRSPCPADPWDCGWWRAGALPAAADFRPRRATLLLVRETDAHASAALRATLHAHSAAYKRPLRVLLVAAAAPGLPRI